MQFFEVASLGFLVSFFASSRPSHSVILSPLLHRSKFLLRLPFTSKTGDSRWRLTCSASVAQHGYATVASAGQSQLFEKMGIGSQWLFLRRVLVEFNATSPVGSAEGTVTGILREVDKGIGRVGSAIVMANVGDGSATEVSTSGSSSCGYGTATANAAKAKRDSDMETRIVSSVETKKGQEQLKTAKERHKREVQRGQALLTAAPNTEIELVVHCSLASAFSVTLLPFRVELPRHFVCFPC